jgi:hypothetical protein
VFAKGKSDIADELVVADRIRFGQIYLATRQSGSGTGDGLM